MLRLSLKVIGNSDDETSLPYKSLLTIRQVTDLRKAFENNLSVNIKLSKTQLSKIIQSSGFPCRLLGPLIKTDLSFLQPLAKSVLIPLGLTAAASAADPGIHKKILSSGTTIIPNFRQSTELFCPT